MKIYKDKIFARFARRQHISDAMLCEAVERANRGLIDADLGGGVIKQRVARPNEGRSGGFRTLIFFRVEDRAFFAFGFAKNDLGNISDSDLNILKNTAKVTLNLTDEAIETLVANGQLTEVNCDENNEQDDETPNL